MSVYSGPLKWYSLARDILTHVDSHTTTRFGRVAVVPGLIAWDGCDCGALYLMVNQTYASEDWPAQKITNDVSDACAAPYEGAEFVLQVMQCAPSGGATGVPTVQEQQNAAMLVRRDAYEVYRAVSNFLCQARDERDVEEFIVDAQLVQGPEGGCVGTELRFRVALTWE